LPFGDMKNGRFCPPAVLTDRMWPVQATVPAIHNSLVTQDGLAPRDSPLANAIPTNRRRFARSKRKNPLARIMSRSKLCESARDLGAAPQASAHSIARAAATIRMYCVSTRMKASRGTQSPLERLDVQQMRHEAWAQVPHWARLEAPLLIGHPAAGPPRQRKAPGEAGTLRRMPTDERRPSDPYKNGSDGLHRRRTKDCSRIAPQVQGDAVLRGNCHGCICPVGVG
jgi:hypothetical protein